jgi:hypothetical protein
MRRWLETVPCRSKSPRGSPVSPTALSLALASSCAMAGIASVFIRCRPAMEFWCSTKPSLALWSGFNRGVLHRLGPNQADTAATAINTWNQPILDCLPPDIPARRRAHKASASVPSRRSGWTGLTSAANSGAPAANLSTFRLCPPNSNWIVERASSSLLLLPLRIAAPTVFR